jgi:Ca-activated chloride channel homolog
MTRLQRRVLCAAVLFAGIVAVAVGLTGFGSWSALSAQAPTQPTFATREELVVLHVMVKDKQGSFVSNLTPDAFVVSEDGQRQTIQFFAEQDAPVTLGLLIDSSGSMRTARDRVIAAASSFVEASNPHDEIFALAFNETVSPALPPDEPFTSDAALLKAALTTTISARGRTALYDAVASGLAYLNHGTQQRQVLIVVSDGGDNASSATFDQVRRKTQVANAMIYAIALADPADPDANPNRLKALAEATGGEAFRPHDVTHVVEVLRRISRDIRNTYTIGYAPTNATRDGRFRRIRVVAKAPDGRSLNVRTRSGYVVEER